MRQTSRLALVGGFLVSTVLLACGSKPNPSEAGADGGQRAGGTAAGGGGDGNASQPGAGGSTLGAGGMPVKDSGSVGTAGSSKGEGGSVGTAGSSKGEGGSVGTGGNSKGGGGSKGTAGARVDAGVSGGDAGSPKTDAGPGTPTSGCGKEKPASPPKELDAAGTQRTFLVDVPASYDVNTPTPVLFAFHGMGITGEFFRSWANLRSAFGATYIVVHPNALGDPTQWDSTGSKDVVFFDAMLEVLESTYCIDAKRVFVTGHSSGGFFTNTLGCQRGDILRGIAPQSGAGPISAKACKGPLAAIIIHGSQDTSVVPAEGAKSRDHWGKAAQCDMGSGETSSLNAVCLEYGGCEAGYPLVYCPYDGDHNLWTSAPKTMFDFFESL